MQAVAQAIEKKVIRIRAVDTQLSMLLMVIHWLFWVQIVLIMLTRKSSDKWQAQW